jgi:hypothetical protein
MEKKKRKRKQKWWLATSCCDTYKERVILICIRGAAKEYSEYW